MTTRSFRPVRTSTRATRLTSGSPPMSARSLLSVPNLCEAPAASRIAPTFAISGTATVLDDLGKDSDRDLSRTLGADCESDGGANAGDIRFRQPGCPQSLNAPRMVALRAERTDIEASRAQGGAERLVVDLPHMREGDNSSVLIERERLERGLRPFGVTRDSAEPILSRERRSRVHDRDVPADAPYEIGQLSDVGRADDDDVDGWRQSVQEGPPLRCVDNPALPGLEAVRDVVSHCGTR